MIPSIIIILILSPQESASDAKTYKQFFLIITDAVKTRCLYVTLLYHYNISLFQTGGIMGKYAILKSSNLITKLHFQSLHCLTSP